LVKACELAQNTRCYIVLKGAYTVVVTPQGKSYFNSTGNPGMATAGSGDVLTGVILSLLAQGYTSEDAARLGVFVHGMAGDMAAEQQGMIALTAGDIVSCLPAAWKALTEK
jgi:NAD(P)H-hydrate epimerase